MWRRNCMLAAVLAVLLPALPCADASGLLIDNFLTNGSVSEPAIGLDSAGATGPTNRVFTGLGTNAIGDRTTSLEVPGGVPSGGYAYVEPTGNGTALFYNYGTAAGVSTHAISWAVGNFDLLSAVGVSTPEEIFFKLDFGENNFPATASQAFGMHVFSAGGGDAFYSATVNSNELAGSTNFSAVLAYQSGNFNATNVSIFLGADLAFAGPNNQFEFSRVSVVPEPSTFALLSTAFASFAFILSRRRNSR